MKKFVAILFLTNVYFAKAYIMLDWDAQNPVLDPNIYKDALDPGLCKQQLEQIRYDSMLAMEFIESGLRIPRGILMGNLVDLGNYHQCIEIDKTVEDVNVAGKYCLLTVPANQELELPTLPDIPGLPEWLPEIPDGLLPEWFPDVKDWTNFNPRRLKVNEDIAVKIRESKNIENAVQTLVGAGDTNKRSVEGTPFEHAEFTLAVCVPKACTVEEGLNGLLLNVSTAGFKYEEEYCRMKNDKLWVPADYVAVVIFSIIGFITILSTSYDLFCTFKLKSDPKYINTVYRSFSLYTNCRRLTTFTTNPGALECVDGIRAIAMMWVIVGHTFSTLPPRINLLESIDWMLSISSQWVSAAPLSVDTFFMLSGMLLVYTTTGKMNGKKLLQNLHVFYLNRLLRMFPLLAAMVLIQASFLHRLADGPLIQSPIRYTENCRNYWWSTLLYVQNYVNPNDMCLPHSWYLAIDIQLHIISPIILFWVLSGSKTKSWIALSAGLLSFLVSATVYNFTMNFPGDILAVSRNDEIPDYMYFYYVNTLTRAAPFFVGMIFGYLLHLFRGKKVEFSTFAVILLWIGAFALTSLAAFSSYPIKDFEWDNQTVDSLNNSFSRILWVTGVGWMIFACVHGYGGPVNWILSLQMWKLPSRLSYGMYLFHYPFMYVTASTALNPIYFTQISTVYRFFSELLIALMVSFVMTLVIDSPFSTLFKLMFGGGPRRPQSQEKNGPPKDITRSEDFDKDKIDSRL